MTRRAILRASDADRELVAERLRQAAAEGRLFADELEERLGVALSAKTYGELDTTLADLPVPAAELTRPPAGLPRAHPAVITAVAVTLALMLVGFVAFAIAGHGHAGHGAGGLGAGAPMIWLVWIALGWRFMIRRRNRSR